MLLVVVVVVGVTIFCFAQGYIGIGLICLAGLSNTVAFPALIVTSIYLFSKGHWITAMFPLMLMAWNIIGLAWLKKR